MCQRNMKLKEGFDWAKLCNLKEGSELCFADELICSRRKWQTACTPLKGTCLQRALTHHLGDFYNVTEGCAHSRSWKTFSMVIEAKQRLRSLFHGNTSEDVNSKIAPSHCFCGGLKNELAFLARTWSAKYTIYLILSGIKIDVYQQVSHATFSGCHPIIVRW